MKPWPFLLSLIILVPLASGAGVSFIPRNSGSNPGITIIAGVNGATVGYLNITNTQNYADYCKDYASNATVSCDARGWEHSEPSNTLYFLVKTYGNGTLTLIILANLSPTRIEAPGSASAMIRPLVASIPFTTTITYTASGQNGLNIVFQPSIQSGITAGAIAFASLLGLLFILIWIRPSLAFLGVSKIGRGTRTIRDPHLRTPQQIMADSRRRFKIIIALLAILVVVAVLAVLIGGLGS